jgi:tetratricopeptide (TPR) repeat protein
MKPLNTGKQIELAAFAAADVSNYAVFDWCCNKVKQRFGDNWRLHRLLGLFHEIRLDYKAAAAVYEAGLAKFPNSPELYKRQVAILKSLNAYEQAATVLCNYLETFMCDEESWSELVYIYMYLRKYEEAAFAVSELIVLAPSNWFYFLLLAEIYYAMGNYQCLLTARKYCCYVCKLQQNCPRVYYDLLLICRSLEKYPRSSKDVNNERLLQYAAKHLKQLYKYSYYLYAVEDLVRK